RLTPGQVGARPRIALAAAGLQLSQGRGDLVEHWLRPAAADPALAGEVAALRAALGRDGVPRMPAQAADAPARLPADSPGQALCRLVAGVAAHLAGEPAAARAQLEDGARRAAVRVPLVQALCLAQLALIALDEHDPEEAAQHAARARAQVGRYSLDRSPASALVFAASALVRAQRGRTEEAA